MRIRYHAAAAFLAVIITFIMTLSVYADELKSPFGYQCGEVRISAGDEWSDAHRVLGREKTYQILPEVINGSKVIQYLYEDCKIRTSKNMKKQTVIDRIILTEKGITDEGLMLGQLASRVRFLYPSATENMGVYTVENGNNRLIIDCGADNNKVLSITYEYNEKNP